MNRIFGLFVALLFAVHMQAQSAHMNFMGIKVGVDSLARFEQVVKAQGFPTAVYDPTNDINAYYGEYRSLESCVYATTVAQVVNRVFFRVSAYGWDKVQPVAAAMIAEVKKKHPDFHLEVNDFPIADVRHRAVWTKGMDTITFFVIERDNGIFDATLTYE